MATLTWVGGTGTWNTVNTAVWSPAQVPTAADNVVFNSATTYTVTMTGALACLDITVSTGTVTFSSTGTLAVSGSMSLSAGTIWNATGTISFNATTSKTITTNGTTISAGMTFNGVGGSWQLIDALTMGATRTITLTNGTLNLNNKAIVTGFFSSNNSNTRTIAFGTGNITCSAGAAGGTLWDTATVTNLTVTGTPVVNIPYSGANTITVSPGDIAEASAISFNFTAGTYSLSFFTTTANQSAKNVNFTGFSGSWSSNVASTIYGNLTLSSTMTVASTTSINTFGATSGTQTITSNAVTFARPATFNGASATFQLADAFSCTALVITAGTLNLGGTLTVAGAITFTAGTFGLNGNSVSAQSFSSSNSNTRTLAFGSGNITCTNAAGGTIWTTATTTGLTVTGTPVVDISNNSVNAATVQTGSLNEANSISFNFIDGAYTLSFLNVGGTNSARNVNFTGFAGTLSSISTATIYGNLTFSSGMADPSSTNVMTFGATSGTQIVTSNGRTISIPITFNGVGGTVRLADAYIVGSARAVTHTNGTLDLNGKNFTATSYTTAAGTKNITFNGGIITISNTFNNAAPTGFTTTAGSGTGIIAMYGQTAKTFNGGGSIYNCTLSNDGNGVANGTLTITGSNTFSAIANGGAVSSPTFFLFTAGTTTTVTNWSVSGTAGNLVTIGSATAASHTLSKSSGVVSSNYLSISRSTATGGAAWYAGANSTNGGNNSGWIFTAVPPPKHSFGWIIT